MAFIPYHSITYEDLGAGNEVVHNGVSSNGVNKELIAPGENSGEISSIMITNTHDTADATFTLFIQDQPTSSAFSTFNIIRKIIIPAGSSLLLDDSKLLSFDNGENGYGLYITVGSSDTLDVIINV